MIHHRAKTPVPIPARTLAQVLELVRVQALAPVPEPVPALAQAPVLAVVIPVLTWLHVRETGREGGAPRSARAASWTRYVPGFVLGFLAMAVVRSVGDAMLAGGRAYGVFDAGQWKALTDVIGDTLASRYLLGTAMAAVGLSTSFRVFRGVGLKPFAVGLAGAVAVGSVGMAMAILFGRFVTL